MNNRECGYAVSGDDIETFRPNGVATDPENGHVYVVDQLNRRIVEFTSWGVFVKAWGWGVRDGAPEPQVCSTATGCRFAAGSLGVDLGYGRTIGGSGAGELADPQGIAVDSDSAVYVVDSENHRIQKFSPAGEFLRTWGGGVVSGGAAGSGDLSSGSVKVIGLDTTSKAFEIGQTVSGVGIPPGTLVRDLGVGTMTLSKAATASGVGVAITAVEGAGNVPTNERQSIAIEGGPTGGSFSLSFNAGELAADFSNGSKQVTNTQVITELTVGSFHVGDKVSGGTIPAATTIAAVDAAAGTLTLSASTTSGAHERLVASEATSPLPFDATAAEVQAALESLPAIGIGNVAVSGAAGGPWTVEYQGPLLGDVNLAPRSGAPLSASATGLTPAGTVKIATLRQGASAPELCVTAADCRAGIEGTADGQFGKWEGNGGVLTVGPADQIYVGDQNRIQKFNTAGEYTGEIALAGKTVFALAADSSGGVNDGDLYASFYGDALFPATPNVAKIGPGGEALGSIEVRRPTALVVDSAGNVFIADQEYFSGNGADPANHLARILEFDPSGKQVSLFAEGEIADLSTGIGTGSACFSEGGDVYFSEASTAALSSVFAYGPPPDQFTGKGEKCEPPEAPPTIDDQYAISVGANDATLAASVNPHFWADTTLYLEYGTEPCSEGGCKAQPAPPGSLLGGGVVSEDVASPGIFLTGLSPATTYHYRFVSKSGGGGPVTGAEATFTTFALPQENQACLNQDLRTSFSAALADCRAYELVSPLDKDGGDVLAPASARLNQSAVSGDGLTYTSRSAFAKAQSAPFFSQYLARRDPATGWSTASISPPEEGPNKLPTELAKVDNLFKAFSPDLSSGWNVAFTEPVLGPGAQPGYPNIYRRDNAAGTYQACTTAQPLQAEVSGPELQAVTPDQSHAVFRTRNRLAPEAATGLGNQLYECSFGEGEAAVRFVGMLPNGTPHLGESSVGTVAASFIGNSRTGTWLDHAISDDGSRVFWTAKPLEGNFGTGTIYLRVNATQEESKHNGSGKCTQALKACTYPVSGSASAEPAFYWGADRSASKGLFSVQGNVNGDLYLFDVAKAIEGEDPKTLIAHKALGVLGASEDLSRIYFLSSEALDAGATAGKPNLYLYEAGSGSVTTSFIATLTGADADINPAGSIFSPVHTRPDHHTSRVSPDGTRLAFTSNSAALAQSLGYDNTDLTSGAPDAEVYRYSLGGKVVCLSCDPTGARPSAGRRIGVAVSTETLYAAARLAPWTSGLYPGNALSDDGSRIYFESYEPLALADTNGTADVYQWEEAGTGDCDEADASFVAASGGCLDLISSGKSPADSEFLDADPSGANVFFTTAQSLLTQDPGSVDVYDARVDGGFAPAPSPPPACEGEACQGPYIPPANPTPASAVFQGAGNVTGERNTKPRCARGKVRRHGRCVVQRHPKHPKKHKRRVAR